MIYIEALFETLFMVLGSGLLAVLFGLPFGVWLFVTQQPHLAQHQRLYWLLSTLVNVFRSIPFIILMIMLIPVSRFLVGTSIGTLAALVPLVITAIPFFARLIEESLQSLPEGLIDAGLAMGATTPQILKHILLPEIVPSIYSHITMLLVNLIGYSAMAGALGGGGLGSLAIHYGYQRFDFEVMLITVIILVLCVQLIQSIGNQLRARFERKISH